MHSCSWFGWLVWIWNGDEKMEWCVNGSAWMDCSEWAQVVRESICVHVSVHQSASIAEKTLSIRWKK
jgi:hypothetical protein